MLRMALIAVLIVLNLSVWVGPAEVIAARGKALIDPRPQYERAQKYVLNGDIARAIAEYQALMVAHPDIAEYHSDYGLLCINNAAYLQEELGWSKTTLTATVQAQLKQARDLTPGDYSASAQYALTLMDEEFFGRELPQETLVEAWNHTLAIVKSGVPSNKTWNGHSFAGAHIHLQLARAAFRYGRTAEVKQHLELALAENPGLRIPRDLLASWRHAPSWIVTSPTP